jgi:hypothetical protein
MFSIKNMWRKFKNAEYAELKDINDIHNLNQKEIQVEIKRYETMLAKLAKDSTRNSFYCLPADENNIPTIGGEFWGFCPGCHQQMEKTIIDHGCGTIYAFYCHRDNLHWVLYCFGIMPSKKRYGPFPCRTGWVVNWVYMQERAAQFAKQGFFQKKVNSPDEKTGSRG